MADDQDNVASDDINNMLQLSGEELRCAGEIDRVMGSIDAGEASNAYGEYCATMDKIRDKVRIGEAGVVTRAQFEEWNHHLGDSADQRRGVITALKRHCEEQLNAERTAVNGLREQLRDQVVRADGVRQALVDANTATDLVGKLLLLKEAFEVAEGVLAAAAEEHTVPVSWGVDVDAGKAATEGIESSLDGLASYSVDLEAVLQGWSGLADMEHDIQTTLRAMHDQFVSMQADTASLAQVNALPDN